MIRQWIHSSGVLVLLGLVVTLTSACATRSYTPVALDVDAMESRLGGEVVAVNKAPHAHVAAVNSELFISVSRSQSAEGEPDQVVIYLCDNDRMGLWLTGDWPEETTTYTADGVTVTLRPTAQGFSGTFRNEGGAVESFVATSATGRAGLYWAEGNYGGRDLLAGWIVLADGQQRGGSGHTTGSGGGKVSF